MCQRGQNGCLTCLAWVYGTTLLALARSHLFLSAFCIFDTFSTSFPVCVILLSSRLLTVLLYLMCQIYSIGMTSGNVMSCMFYCMYQIYSVGRGHCPALQLTWGSHSSPAINVVCYRSLECIHIKCENEQVVRNK